MLVSERGAARFRRQRPQHRPAALAGGQLPWRADDGARNTHHPAGARLARCA